MTTAILFKKHRAGEISKEKFLYEVRRDQQLPFITNMTSYEDSIKILKNKGIVREAAAADNIHPYTLKKGIQSELEKSKDLSNASYTKAVEKATKKLSKNPKAYDSEVFSNSAKIDKADAKLKMKEVQKDNHTDKDNGMKKVKGFHDAKANTKASKKETRKGNPKGVKIMKESHQILKDLLSKKKVELNEDMHPVYGLGQEVPLPQKDRETCGCDTGIVKSIVGGTLELEIKKEGQEPTIIHRQVNVIDKAKEDAAAANQTDTKADLDKAWSDWDKRGEKTFAGMVDFPSKINHDQQKSKMSDIIKKLKEYITKGKKKKDVDEATKFRAGGEVIFTADNMANDKKLN